MMPTDADQGFGHDAGAGGRHARCPRATLAAGAAARTRAALSTAEPPGDCVLSPQRAAIVYRTAPGLPRSWQGGTARTPAPRGPRTRELGWRRHCPGSARRAAMRGPAGCGRGWPPGRPSPPAPLTAISVRGTPASDPKVTQSWTEALPGRALLGRGLPRPSLGQRDHIRATRHMPRLVCEQLEVRRITQGRLDHQFGRLRLP